MRVKLVVGTTLIALALVGCSNDPEVKEATGDTSAAKPSADAPSDEEVETFFNALGSDDPEDLEAAIELAAPDSIAAAYAAYHLNSLNASIDAGYPFPADKVTKSKDGFKSCYVDPPAEFTGDPCVTWGGIESENGKIAKLTVDGKDLADRISIGDGSKIKAGRLGNVEFLSAYQSVQSGALFVNLRVKSKSQALGPDFYGAKYRAPDGRQSTASGESTVAPDEISPDSKTFVTLAFDRAKPGGEVILRLSDVDYNLEQTVNIPTR